MDIKETLQFIFLELKTAIIEKSRDRISELGTTIDILYEAAKKYRDNKTMNLLEDFDYVVFHYDEEFSFTEQRMEDIEKKIESLFR